MCTRFILFLLAKIHHNSDEVKNLVRVTTITFQLDCHVAKLLAMTRNVFRNSFFRNLGIGNVGIISTAGININFSFKSFLEKYHISKTTLITSQYHFFSRQNHRS